MPPIDAAALLRWFEENQRDLPWRATKDPYSVWVSEIMLQQTQVATVLPFYARWMQDFSDVQSLAASDEQAVLNRWAGLGYYRRARLLHAGAKWVMQNGMPTTETEWRAVPGVGPYTAAAIASICFDEPVALVDGNVERVFARLTSSPLCGPALNRAAWRWAQEHVVAERPGEWNQALMELGATICMPRNARCDKCPLSNSCTAEQPLDFPHRADKRPTIELNRTLGVPTFGGKLGLVQIPPGQWWEGLWEFPELGQLEGSRMGRLKPVRHSVTHHRITVSAEVIRLNGPLTQFRWVERTDLANVPLPSAQMKLALSAFELLHNRGSTA